MRKEYVKPNIESGEAVEQTALACNVARLPYADVCDWGTDISIVDECTTSPFKGGNWTSEWVAECTSVPPNDDIECAVLLS